MGGNDRGVAVGDLIETQCVYCGEPLTADTLTIDHVIPLSRGGTNFERNKAPACRPCNFEKAQLTAEEYLRMRGDPEEMEAYKRALHDEMSRNGWARNRELHRPLPNPPPKPPPVRTFSQADAERREASRQARLKAKAGECIKELGFTCHCQVCDPGSLERFHDRQERLTQDLKDQAALRFAEEVLNREPTRITTKPTPRTIETLAQWEEDERQWDKEHP